MPDMPIAAPRTPTLAELEDRGAFARRHIGPDADDQAAMLAMLGFGSRAELIDAVVPKSIRRKQPMEIGAARTEGEALSTLHRIAEMNQVFKSYIGQGYYATDTPSVILLNVFQSPAWYTAYTPYQPEISQGRLEALINFQTMVADLTGLDTANASMLDEGTAVVEGMLLARRASGSASNVFLVDADALPQTLRLLAHRAEPLGISLVTTDFAGDLPDEIGRASCRERV